MENLKIDLQTFETRNRRNQGRIRKILKSLAALFLVFVLALIIGRWIIPAVLDAAEREAQWKAERLCKIYEVCDTRRGA